MSLALELQWVDSAPAKVSGKDLGIFIPMARGCACNQGVTEHLMCNVAVAQHAIISWILPSIWCHSAGAMLGGNPDGLFSLRRRDSPTGGKVFFLKDEVTKSLIQVN